MQKITTLQQLADYINSQHDYPANVNRIIEENGWEDLSNDMYDICAFNGEKVTLDENTAVAKVVDL